MRPTKKEYFINGPRPSPLKINRASTLIKKPYSTYPNAGPTVNFINQKQQKQQQQGQPVIIYMHSPKIIHAKPREFMALVQKLTGYSRSKDKETSFTDLSVRSEDSNDSYSVLKDENYGGGNIEVVEDEGNMNRYFENVPLFTPSSIDFSQRGGYSRSCLESNNPLSSLSPSFMEFLNGLQG